MDSNVVGRPSVIKVRLLNDSKAICGLKRLGGSAARVFGGEEHLSAEGGEVIFIEGTIYGQNVDVYQRCWDCEIC